MDNVVDSFRRRLGLSLAISVVEMSLVFQRIFSSGLLNAKRAQNGGFRRPEKAPKHNFFKFFPSNVLRHDFNQFWFDFLWFFSGPHLDFSAHSQCFRAFECFCTSSKNHPNISKKACKTRVKIMKMRSNSVSESTSLLDNDFFNKFHDFG